MEKEPGTSYVPALRLKKGECFGLASLASDVVKHVTPRLIVPPLKDRDFEGSASLASDEIAYGIGRRIAANWPLRPAYLETRFLFPDFAGSKSSNWLPRIFGVARDATALLIPVANIDELAGEHIEAYRLSLSNDTSIRLAIRIASSEIDDSLENRLLPALVAIDLSPQECALMLDFADADLSDFEIASAVLAGALETVQSIGLWHDVIFQGTNFPETNPAQEGASTHVPRNEWLAWKALCDADPSVLKYLIFGDYCADNAKFQFQSGGIPIRHYRYSTEMHWRVERGQSKLSTRDAMRAVCKSIVESEDFAGREFSSADNYIYATANGNDGPGCPWMWRGINTTHHITQVVSDLSKMKGFVIAKRDAHPSPQQLSLIDDEL